VKIKFNSLCKSFCHNLKDLETGVDPIENKILYHFFHMMKFHIILPIYEKSNVRNISKQNLTEWGHDQVVIFKIELVKRINNCISITQRRTTSLPMFLNVWASSQAFRTIILKSLSL
jgi:hypothetical protein